LSRGADYAVANTKRNRAFNNTPKIRVSPGAGQNVSLTKISGICHLRLHSPGQTYRMRREERETINRDNVNVTRSTTESEDIDLAAEATASAPAKSLPPGSPAELRPRTRARVSKSK